MSLRADFCAFDDGLAALGIPSLTDWWRDGVGKWLDAYESDRVLELVACVGRGAAKSTALYKIALFFALFGHFDVPPGERHYAVLLSRQKEEASKGVAIIARWLTLLGVEHRVAGDVVDLADLPRGIRVVAASVAATSGWRAFFVGRDERSKWSQSGAAENEQDASEIDTSAAAMSATHALAPQISVGSAWGSGGGFHEAVMGGSNESRVVLGPAASWVAAPHLREADLRRKERDPKRFAREYECVFQASDSAAFEPDDVDAAFSTILPTDVPFELGEKCIVIDAASGGGDAFSFCVVGWRVEAVRAFKLEYAYHGATLGWLWDYQRDKRTGELIPADPSKRHPSMLVFEDFDAVRGKFAGRVTAEEIVAKIAALARRHGIRRVLADQRESLALSSIALRHGLQLQAFPWTGENKTESVARIRRLMRDRQIVLPASARELRTELAKFEEKITPAGNFQYRGRAGSHDDFVALLLTAAIADAAGAIPSSPVARTVVRNFDALAAHL